MKQVLLSNLWMYFAFYICHEHVKFSIILSTKNSHLDAHIDWVAVRLIHALAQILFATLCGQSCAKEQKERKDK